MPDTKKFLDYTGTQELVKEIQKKYPEQLTSGANGSFTYKIFKDTDDGIVSETKTITTGANNVAVATGDAAGKIAVTTNGTTVQVPVKDVVTNVTGGTNSGTIKVTINSGADGAGVATDNIEIPNVVTTDGIQTITGAKTFHNITVPTNYKITLTDAPANGTDAANKKYVDDKIAAADAMVYKGTVGTGGTVTTLPTSGVVVGDTYKACSAITGTVTADIGDLIIAQSVTGTQTQTITWDVIPSGNDITQVIAGTGLTGGGSSGSVTLSHSNSITAGTASGSSGAIAEGGTINIPSITYDAQGHITSKDTTSVTIPAAYTEGPGIDITNKKISVDLTSTGGLQTTGTGDAATLGIKLDSDNSNGLGLSASGLKLALATNSTKGAVQVTNGNGLSITNGVVAMALADGTTTAGAVKVNAGNGLTYGSGIIGLSLATGSANGAMSSTDKAKLDLLQALPTAVGTYVYTVATADTAGAYETITSITASEIDSMWTATA